MRSIDKWSWYMFVAIVVYLIVVNYKGSEGLVGTTFGGVTGLVTALQGRNPTKTVVIRRRGGR